MRAVRIGLIVAAAVAAGPALAQAMPGSTVGLPANPFASNYPSEPPRMQPDRALRPAGRGVAARRHANGQLSVRRLRPPADVPAGRARR